MSAVHVAAALAIASARVRVLGAREMSRDAVIRFAQARGMELRLALLLSDSESCGPLAPLFVRAGRDIGGELVRRQLALGGLAQLNRFADTF